MPLLFARALVFSDDLTFEVDFCRNSVGVKGNLCIGRLTKREVLDRLSSLGL